MQVQDDKLDMNPGGDVEVKRDETSSPKDGGVSNYSVPNLGRKQSLLVANREKVGASI